MEKMEAGRRGGGLALRHQEGKRRKAKTLSCVIAAQKHCELCQHAGNKGQDKTLLKEFRKMEMQFETAPTGHMQPVKLD